MLDCRGLCGYLVCITFAVDKHMPSWPSANMNPWKKLGKYFQDKSGSLTLPKSSADREWERERESKLPMQTYCLKANGNIIMMDRPGFLSSEKRIRTLNGIGTDQYLHWTGSYILLLWRSKKNQSVESILQMAAALPSTPARMSEISMNSYSQSTFITPLSFNI